MVGKLYTVELGRRWGCRFDAVGVTNQPHQSPSRPRASPSGMTCLVQCVQRNRISLRDKQLASINTVYIFLYIYLQLYISFPKTHTHTHLPLSSLTALQPLSLPHPHTFHMSAHVRRAAPPIRRRSLSVASQTHCQSSF